MKKTCIAILAFLFSYQSLYAAPLTFEPRLTLSEEYNSNFFLDREDEQETYITTITPGFTLVSEGRLAGLSLAYDPSYIAYSEFEEYNYWRHQVIAHGYLNFSRHTTMEVDNVYLLTDDPISEVEGLQVDPTVRQGRNTYITNTASVSLTHQFGTANSFSLIYEHSFLDNDDPTFENNQRYAPRANLTYWVVPNSVGIESGVSYTRGDFATSDDLDLYQGELRLIKRIDRRLDIFLAYEHSIAEYEGTSEDFKVYEPSLGLEYAFDTRSHMTVALGYFQQDRETSEDDSGFSVDANIEKGWATRRGGVYVNATSGWETTYFGAENLGFTIFYEGGLRGEYAFSSRFSGNASVRYRKSEFTDQDPDREDDLLRAGLGLTYQALTWLYFDLSYGYNQLDSNLDENDYHEHTALLSVTFRPMEPFPLTK